MSGPTDLPTSPYFRIEPLAPGVWAALATEGQPALSNSGIIDLGEFTVVFDATLTVATGEALAKAAQQLTGRRADVLLYSHWHGDHTRGAAGFAPVVVASSRRTREVLDELARPSFLEERSTVHQDLAELAAGRGGWTEADRQMLRAWREGIAATPDDVPLLLPAVAFEERLELHGRRRSLELRAYAGGHSPSDVVAFLPDDRLAFLGDLGMVGYQPWTTDGSAERFGAALDAVAALAPDRFVPGHGAIGDRRALAELRRYVQAVQDAAGRPSPPGGDERLRAPPPFDQWVCSDQFGTNVAHERALRAPAKD